MQTATNPRVAQADKEFAEWQRKQATAKKSSAGLYLLRKSKGYEYTNYKGHEVIVPPSPIHSGHTTIHRHEIDEFLHERQIPTIKDAEGKQWHHKLKYNFTAAGQYQQAAEITLHFLSDHAQHTHNNPLISPFGHRVVFHPDQRSTDRLGYKKALIEYALHSTTQTKTGTHEDRLFDRDKARHLHMIKEVIQHADDFVADGDKVTYWKVIRQGNKPAVLALLEMQKEGNELLPQVMRYKTIMPNRKVPEKVTPTTDPIAVGFVPAQTDGEASQVDGFSKAIIAKVTEEFNKSFTDRLVDIKPSPHNDIRKCKIRSTLDTQSGLSWTPNPEVTGHSIRF